MREEGTLALEVGREHDHLQRHAAQTEGRVERQRVHADLLLGEGVPVHDERVQQTHGKLVLRRMIRSQVHRATKERRNLLPERQTRLGGRELLPVRQVNAERPHEHARQDDAQNVRLLIVRHDAIPIVHVSDHIGQMARHHIDHEANQFLTSSALDQRLLRRDARRELIHGLVAVPQKKLRRRLRHRAVHHQLHVAQHSPQSICAHARSGTGRLQRLTQRAVLHAQTVNLELLRGEALVMKHVQQEGRNRRGGRLHGRREQTVASARNLNKKQKTKPREGEGAVATTRHFMQKIQGNPSTIIA